MYMYKKKTLARPILTAAMLSTVLTTTACAPVKDAQLSIKNTFANEDPCSNNAKNVGIVAGAVLGGIIANKLGDDVAASVMGVAAGAAIGGLIGHDMDNRRCELSKISKKYKVPIQSQPIKLAEAGINHKKSKSYKKDDVLGLKVNLQDTGQQFITGSSQLTPQAKEYFTRIAQSYNRNDSKNKNAVSMVKNRQILIIGHTDDVGDSNSNAVLAEKRALAVAKIFKKQGISSANIHYQGAGETQPIADNRTAEGRIKNRRAEIIDLPDSKALYAYLQNRKPVVAYYRPKVGQVNTSPKINKVKTSINKWQFQGEKLTASNASVSVGSVMLKKDTMAFMSALGISSAHASSDVVYSNSCSVDKHRVSGNVKSLKTGKSMKLKTKDYLPGLNNTVWVGNAGKHTFALSGVAVPRDASNGIKNPKVSIYKEAKLTKKSKAAYNSVVKANAYHGKDGVLYRVFFDEKSPVKCVDLVMPNKAPFKAQTGYLIYPDNQNQFVTEFKPHKI